MSTQQAYLPKMIGLTIPVEPYVSIRRDLLLVDELLIPTAKPLKNATYDYFTLLASWVDLIREDRDIQWLESKGLLKLVEIDENDFKNATFGDNFSFLSWAIAIFGCTVLGAIEENDIDPSTILDPFFHLAPKSLCNSLGKDFVFTKKFFYRLLAHMIPASATRVAGMKQRKGLNCESVSLNTEEAQRAIDQATNMLSENLPVLKPDPIEIERIKGTPIFQTLSENLKDILPADTPKRICRALKQPQLPNTSVIEIVLKQFPMPREEEPIEKYVDFSNDPDTNVKLARLRFWMRTTASKKKSTNEIEQELQELLFEYDQHMKLHKLKSDHGIWRTILTTTADVLDNLVRFKSKPVVESIYKLGEKRIQLIETENIAPGREVSYLHAVQNKLS